MATSKSPPTRGVWIEIDKAAINAQIKDVTPHTGGVD